MGSHLFWEAKIPSDNIIPKCHIYRHSSASRNPGFPLTLRNEKCKAGDYRLKKKPYRDGFIDLFYMWNSNFWKGELS